LSILVIEDEKKIALPLQKGSESRHYNVQVALTGEEGFFLLWSRWRRTAAGLPDGNQSSGVETAAELHSNWFGAAAEARLFRLSNCWPEVLASRRQTRSLIE
jgi:DNA-binding response OmpR family regulator